MTDEQKKQARQLYVDGKSPTEIGATLGAAIAWVNAVLGIPATAEGDAAPAKVREVPPTPAKSQSLLEAEAVAYMNEELRARLSYPGYRTEPGGGKLRDGRPAPAAGEMHKAFDPNRRWRGRLGL